MVGAGVGFGSPKPDMVSLHRAVSEGEGWGEGVVQGVLAVLAGGGELGALCTQQYLEHLMRLYLLGDRLVSQQLTEALALALEERQYEDGPPMELLQPHTLEYIVLQIMPVFKNRVEKEKEVAVLGHWNILVQLMGRHLHQKTTHINGMMTVVERAFKIIDPSMLEASFSSWKTLMSNFALDAKILRNPRRINLLIRPLMVNNAKTEGCLRAKFMAWWHLISLLGEDISQHLDTVLLPFLKFCYGSPEDHAAPLAPTSPHSPATPQSPVKKHSALARLALEALVQLVARRPLDQALPRPELAALPCPALTPLQLCQNADKLLHAVQEATSLLSPGNRSCVLQLQEVWAGLSSLLSQLSATSTQSSLPTPAVQGGLAAYLAAVRQCVVTYRRQQPLGPLLLGILGHTAKLPSRVLNSAQYGSDGKRPSSQLLELLLYPDFMEEASKGGELGLSYSSSLSLLAACLVTPPAPLAGLREVLARLEVLAPGLSPNCTASLATVWVALATAVTKLEVLSDPPVSGGVATFTTCLHLLLLPPSLLHTLHREEKMWSAWSSLHTSVSGQASLTVGLSSGHLAQELGDRLASCLPHPASAQHLAVHARCARLGVASLDLSSLARSLASEGTVPLAGFRRIVAPVGSATPLLAHLRALAGQMASLHGQGGRRLEEGGQGGREVLEEGARDVLGAVTLLAGVTHQQLVRPFLKLLAPTLSPLLSCSSLHPALGDLLESTYTATCNLLKVRYKGEYTSELLEEVQELLVAGMQSQHRNLRNRASETWAVTFSSLPPASLPEGVREALQQPGSPCKTGRQQVSLASQVSFPSSSSSGDSFTQQVTGLPSLVSGIRTTGPLVASPGASAKKKMPAPAAQPGKRTRKSLSLLLEDEDTADFVVVAPSPRRKRVLTEHQKDKMTSRHDDIPALYSELSRDDSVINLPPEFQSQDSQSLSMTEKPPEETPDDEKKTEAEEEVASSSASVYTEREEVANNLANTERIEEFDSSTESESLLKKTMKAAKNKRFDPMIGTPTERTSRSPLRRKPLRLRGEEKDEERVESIDSIGTEAEAIEKEAEITITSPENVKKILFDESSISNCSSQDDEEVIESSQDVTEDAGRRSRNRRTVTPFRAAMAPSAKSTPSPLASPRKKTSAERAVEKKNKFGETPLHLAAKKGDLTRVQELLEAGASPNTPDAAGWYPLHEAANSAKPEAAAIVSLLVSRGALVSVGDPEGGVTPLHDAVAYGSREVVVTLLQAGADPGAKNKSGTTALELAKESPELLKEMQEQLRIRGQGEKVDETMEVEDMEVTAEAGDDETEASEATEAGDIDKDGARAEVDSSDDVVEPEEKSDDEIEEEIIADKFEDPTEEPSEEAEAIVKEAAEAMEEEESVAGEKPVEKSVAAVNNLVSPDANKENVSEDSSEEGEKEVEKIVGPPTAPLQGRTTRPFTALNEKSSSSKAKLSGRGAMLLSLARNKTSLEAAQAGLASPLLSPKVSGKEKRPWAKYAPSPSSASPSQSCLKRSADDLDSSLEGTPNSKRARLSGIGPRKVHFNDNPVSESVEIPRASESKVTRKKLLMSLAGYDQELTLPRPPERQENKEGVSSLVFPEMSDCQEPVSTIAHQLATGQWFKVMEQDFRENSITKVGQLASMDCGQIRQLRGLKPPKEVTVRNALRGLQARLRKGSPLQEPVVRVRAPVVDTAATMEEEEESIAALFSRPSPTPQEEGEEHPAADSQVARGESPSMSPIQSPHMRSLAKEEPEEETVKEEVEEEDRLQEVGERDGLEDLLGNSTDSGEEDVREEEVKGEQEADKGTKEVQEAEMEVTEQEDPESQAEMEVVAAGSVDLFQETQGEQEQEEGGEVEAAGGAAMEEEATKEAAPAPGPSLTSGQQGAASFSSLSLSSEEVSTRGQGVVSTSGQETVSWQGLLAFLTRQEEVLEGGSPSQLGELGRNLGQGLARMVQLQCKLVEKCVGKEKE